MLSAPTRHWERRAGLATTHRVRARHDRIHHSKILSGIPRCRLDKALMLKLRHEADDRPDHFQVYSGQVRVGTIYKTSGNPRQFVVSRDYALRRRRYVRSPIMPNRAAIRPGMPAPTIGPGTGGTLVANTERLPPYPEVPPPMPVNWR
jgi:hypothetical protein